MQVMEGDDVYFLIIIYFGLPQYNFLMINQLMNTENTALNVSVQCEVKSPSHSLYPDMR